LEKKEKERTNNQPSRIKIKKNKEMNRENLILLFF